MLLHEIRFGARALARVPSLTAISILTVALGAGAGTALFSVVKAVLLNPLPYPDPGRLAWVAEINDHGHPTQVAYQNFVDWQSQNRSFSALAADEEGPAVVAGSDVPQSSYGAAVTEDFFKVLGTGAILGRTFSHQEQVPGGPSVVVLGYGLWQRAFGGDRKILGRSIRLFGLAPVVIGVMPPGFSFPERAELWMPMTTFGAPEIGNRTGHNWRVIGRLRPGVPMERAQADLSAIERRIKQQYPSPFQSKDAAVVSLKTHVAGDVRRPLLLLFGAVGFVLLIVCVNVANLLLVRVTARSRELAVRMAIGARRIHLVRQMLVESLLLGFAGGAAGLLLAAFSMALLRVLLPADMPRAGDIRMDGGVVLFALSVSTAAGILFGLLPAWRASAMNVNAALKAGSRAATASKRSERTMAALVISEACLSLVLVAGAGLLVRSFWNLRSVDPGFRSGHVLTAETQFEPQRRQSLVVQYRSLLQRVRALPGVEAAGTTRSLPIEDAPDGHFFVEGRRTDMSDADALYNVISPGYLKALRIPLLRGRDFTEQDTETSQPVAIVSAEMARAYFPNADPIGQRIWFDSFTGGAKEHWLTIVGVAADIRQDGLTRAIESQAYACYTQQPSDGLLSGGTLVVRSRFDPAALAAPVRAVIHAVNPDAAPAPRTMDSVLAASLSKQRFQMEILGGFAIMALLLAAIGLYGVLSHLVTANRSQIGIRLALGASRGRVFRMIAARALGLAALGVAAGLLGCIALRRVLVTVLFGIGPNDPVTIAAAIAILLAVALAAAWFPARRATRVDPMTALREE
ncbi:MAG TPA: ABC transporter permease [Bryobacteraceae bacterium]|nr:ABC transporter permease [Bryobacteraceae bacterium]